LSGEALKALKGWREQSSAKAERVFPADDGGRLDNVRSSWAALLKDAGIANFRWHDMRHHFASKLVMKGVPLNTVRELCGHADSNTTLRYAHLAQSHKADAVALLD
jgi:integrase